MRIGGRQPIAPGTRIEDDFAGIVANARCDLDTLATGSLRPQDLAHVKARLNRRLDALARRRDQVSDERVRRAIDARR